MKRMKCKSSDQRVWPTSEKMLTNVYLTHWQLYKEMVCLLARNTSTTVVD